MKRKAFITMILAVTLGLVAMPLVSCGEVSFTTARLSEITMASSINQSTYKPIDKTDTFSVDTPEIFLSAKFSNAPADTEVTAEWIYVSGEVADLENYNVDTVSINVSGTDYLYFSLLRPDAGWPKGNYQVVLSIDGKEQAKVPFTVK